MAGFVKLDCGILDSTLWVDKDARDIFITALLMAEPWETSESVPQVVVDGLDLSGWEVPPGWYGFVHAAGPGIVRRAGVAHDAGMAALQRLGDPEPDSRTPEFGGRRLVRVSGGYLVLNFMRYRDRDYTAAERQRRFRQRAKDKKMAAESNAVTSNDRDVTSPITQAEAEAEAEAEGLPEIDGNKGETSESSVGMDLIPTRETPIAAKDVLATLKQMGQVQITKKYLLGWRIRVVFGYWIAKFDKDNARTKLTHGRWARLEKYLGLYDIETCLYAIDGAAIHPHANQEDGRTFHEFPEIFMNKPEGPDRVEKYSEYARAKDKHSKHRLLEKHPELEGVA